MTPLDQFLCARFESGGFSTEDALVSFLPLVRETIATHKSGNVAPLEGIGALHVDDPRIWFEERQRRPPRNAAAALRQIEAANRSAVEVVDEFRRTTDLDDGDGKVVDLAIGQPGQPITRPVFLPGYVTWEHQIEHHDQLTDVFSLGLILASLACGLDFAEESDLREFVTGRRNLFALAPQLHPVLARAITRMTELDRHRRVRDLPALLSTLENYRDQEIDFEYDLARIPGFGQKDLHSKQQVVLERLRERLFELTRRNRLLQFRPTMHSVNLTHASVPLSFDIKNIRADQILIWNDELQAQLAGGKAVSLNKYLNFTEALYLPSVLDRVIADTRRDQAEFGFAQLRLVVCFLHWANLKEKPVEQFDSPLLLLPVELKKKKGIRDTYWLSAPTAEAEVNPLIRHQFKQLYGIDLPDTVDLAAGSLDRFFDYLQGKIESSDVAVTLTKIDRPRISLVYDKARRKLDQYRRRARLAGRGVRSFLDLDYSYDPANYHPLGVRLYAAKIRTPSTHLREIIEEKPRGRSFAAPETEPPAVEKERTFFSLQEGGEENPFHWTFDLCSVALANFKYRKMSLVRDYDALLQEPPDNEAFDATFSLSPRPVQREIPTAPPLQDRYDVVPCDPTQAAAIEEARRERSYIIQGPPGTGKSQTITNLIADYVARGKRVLFVCQKRAAIDVVYARLRQRGLADLCCLIHDSQTDKKEFVMDLKQTYESSLAHAGPNAADGRTAVLNRLVRELAQLERFDEAMQTAPAEAGLPVRQLLSRCIELREMSPDLSPIEQERLPQLSLWRQFRRQIVRFQSILKEIQSDCVLANHPLRLLSPRLASVEQPLGLATAAIENAQAQLDRLEQALALDGLPLEPFDRINRLRQLARYAKRAEPVARAGQMALLDGDSDQAAEFQNEVRQLGELSHALEVARQTTKAWRQKLPAAELPSAIDQAAALERAFLPWLRPSWWRFRGIMNRAYDFQSHVIRPTWKRALTDLQTEYQRLQALEQQKKKTAEAFGLEGNVDTAVQEIVELRSDLPTFPESLQQLHAALLDSREASAAVAALAAIGSTVEALHGHLRKIADDFEELSLAQLREDTNRVLDSLDDLPDYLHCLAELAEVPPAVNKALRTLALNPLQIEAAAADRALQEIYRRQRDVSRFSADALAAHVEQIESLYDQWLDSNAEEIRGRVRQRFLENIHISEQPAAQLSGEQKEFKKRYRRGRRELEHEFGKSMRYKPIRDLFGGESGEVIKDLKPVWLMSPLSVSDTLPLDTTHFDVVIFDEASQIPLEEAVPPVFRAPQAIVVGDEMQLPPTDFFSARRADEEDELLIEEEGELISYDLESNSFLNHAAKNLSSTMLGWHYRSRSESLISFSNWTFYDGRLLTVPEETLPHHRRPAIIAEKAEDGAAGAAEALTRAISFHFMQHGVYEKRRNRAEAEYIAHMVRAMLAEQGGHTIGVVAFSEAQQDEIEAALARLAQEDKQFAKLLDAELEREQDGQFVGLLVKNLENIQGDERDVIILSVCYGHDREGKMRMNFGPINQNGGEKRLNVAFSRAKHHMLLVSSIRHSAITNEYNDGANCLKQYLRYAEAVSEGDSDAAENVLHGMARWQDRDDSAESSIDVLAEQLAEALDRRGYQVDRDVGQSHFRCDLAVRRRDEPEYCLGVLIDSDAYYEQSDILERDMMRPRLLRNFGWKIARVLAKDWYANPESIVARLTTLIEGE